MTSADVATLITAISAVLIAGAGFIAALTKLLPMLRSIEKTANVTHDIVNSQRTEMMEKIETQGKQIAQLVATLIDKRIVVPDPPK